MAERRLFRFAGGKAHLIDRVAPMIKAHLAVTGGKLVSPFYGSGAIEQAVGGEQVAEDANLDLICFWREAREQGLRDALLDFDELARRGGKRTRSAWRAVQRFQPFGDVQRAARFLWLQTFAFNGLWRVNKRSGHNAPPDPARLARRYPFPEPEVFARVRDSIARTSFSGLGWRHALRDACPGDVVLADPPYGSFDQYTAAGFSDDDHVNLSFALSDLRDEGVAVVAFNAPSAEGLYSWAHVETLTRSGRISSKGGGRAPVGELLITAGLRGAQEQAA